MKTPIQSILQGLPAAAQPFSPETNTCEGAFVRFPRQVLAEGTVSGLSPINMARWMSLGKNSPWWIMPSYGSDLADLAKITQPSLYLLWQRTDGTFGLMLPLVNSGLRAMLRGGKEAGLVLAIDGGVPNQPPPDDATLLFVAVGKDPYELSARAVESVAAHLATFRTRTQKRTPAWVDYLGWCTWDAFYGEVDEEKTLAGLESFKKGGLQPQFVILDDGWQDIRRPFMRSMGADPRKFPTGLAGLIGKAKEKFGVKLFGVWHTLQGYWQGVDPEGPLAVQYRMLYTKEPQPKKEDGTEQPDIERCLVHPQDITRFFQEWHALLRSWGVDMVKVDNQGSMEFFGKGSVGPVETMKAYQYAVQGSTHTHFEGNFLHCMSDCNEVAYHMMSSVAWRNSDDFFPTRPHMHQSHIRNNAMNAMWVSQFALPDWDMFQTKHEVAVFHGMARAISGGPVYVSDKPEAHDFKVLRKLCTSDGKALRCEQPALPSRDRIFVDVFIEPRLMKVFNRHGEVGVLGLFHCLWNEDASKRAPITDTFSAADVEGLKGTSFAMYLHEAGTLAVVKRTARQKITLGFNKSELATFAPIVNGIAVLGLLDKYNGPRAVECQEWRDGGKSLWLSVRDGGRIAFYAAKAPKKVLVNGKAVRPTYDRKTGLLVIKRPEGKAVELTIVR